MNRSPAAELLIAAALLVAAVIFGIVLLIALFKLKALAGIDVLFYRGLVLIALAAMAVFAFGLWITARVDVPASVALAAAAVSASVNLAVLIVLPVTIDRSVSVFILGYMDRHPTQAFTPSELDGVFDEIYLGRWAQMQRRMDEQTLSRNVTPSGKGYRISPQGRAFVAFSRKIAWLFDADPRFVDADTHKAKSDP